MSQHIETRLPSYPTAFIGREAEIAAIAQRLSNADCRLLTLVGPGGIGKTRLAVETAKSIVGDNLASSPTEANFLNGIYFVDLQPVSVNDLIVTTIANALGVMLSGSETPREQLLTYLSTRHTLLVIDNFEHLLDSVDLLTDIVKVAPGVKLLVTSREALNVQEEWLQQVGGLQVPDNGNSGNLDEYSAVRMFIERAHHVRADFALIGQEQSVTRVCQMVEGMPLALELAASWVKVLNCDEIAAEIQDSLDFLTTNTRNMPVRHRSMQAVFEHSWRLLAASERAIFPKLSVFRGGFRREAAEQVAGASLPILAGLVDKSFLRLSTAGRYEVHELMRQYGEQHLEDSDSLRDAHSAHYLEFLAERETDIKGRRQVDAIQEIEADFDNICTAWYRAADQKNETAIYKATSCLMWFCQVRRPLYRREIGPYALERFAPQPNEPPGLVWANILYAMHSISTGEIQAEAPVQTKPMIEQSLAAAEALQHRELIAACRLELGAVLVREESRDALPLLKQAMADLRTLDDQQRMAATLVWMGYHYLRLNPDRGIQLFQECADLSLQIGEYNLAGWTMLNLCVAMFRTGRLDRDEPYVRKAISLFTQTGCHTGLLAVKHRLSFMAFFQGKFEEARALNVEAHQAAVDANYLGETLGTLLGAMFIACIADEDYVRTRQIYDAFVSGWSSRATVHAHFFAAIMASAAKDYGTAKQCLYKTLDTSFARTFITLRLVFLSAAVLILAGEGEAERAVEILGLIFNHPASPKGWLEKWGLLNRLRVQLCSVLGETAYTTIWERGAKADLDTIVGKLLEEWQENNPLVKQQSPLAEMLTIRELEVLRLVASGHTNRQIAHELILSLGTVKTHIHNIYGKLGVEGRVQVTTRAKELHLL